MAGRTRTKPVDTAVSTEEKSRKPRDTTPVELLSEITVASVNDIPVGARQRTENPFTDAVKDTYDNEFYVSDQYATAQVDNVFRAVKQLNSAAQANGIGVRILVQDVDGGYDRDSTKPGTVWFRGKPKNVRKTADAETDVAAE